MTDRSDVIIVGGGSAGCALANRLSADPSTRVLVLEAGRSDWRLDPFIHMPSALAFPIGSRFYDWKYESEPEPFMGGRRIYHARGKVLGGSSSINGMIFQRGNPLDYERWAADPGMETWSYAHCLPYFKRMEDCTAAAPDDPWRGHGGPLVLERGPATSPLFRAWFGAGVQAGYQPTDDVNGYRQGGLAGFDRNIGRGSERIGAGEVIVAGGAFNSPQLLQLSGVGAADELRVFGIPIVADLPGVGQNLQDHLEAYIQYGSSQPVSMQPYATQLWRRPFIGAEWLFLRSGPGATNHFEAGGFVRSN